MWESILRFLLESELVGMTTLSLSAVGSFDGEGCITLSANLFLNVAGFGNGSHGGIHTSSSQSEDEMKGRLLLDVVIGKSSAV
jgi:hypothetical protein